MARDLTGNEKAANGPLPGDLSVVALAVQTEAVKAPAWWPGHS
jgi:hypothetical protein